MRSALLLALLLVLSPLALAGVADDANACSSHVQGGHPDCAIKGRKGGQIRGGINVDSGGNLRVVGSHGSADASCGASRDGGISQPSCRVVGTRHGITISMDDQSGRVALLVVAAGQTFTVAPAALP